MAGCPCHFFVVGCPSQRLRREPTQSFLLRVRRGFRDQDSLVLCAACSPRQKNWTEGGRGAWGAGAVSAVHGRPSGSRYYVMARFDSRALGKVLGLWAPGLGAGAKSRLDWAGVALLCRFLNTTAIFFDCGSRVTIGFAADARKLLSKQHALPTSSSRTPTHWCRNCSLNSTRTRAAAEKNDGRRRHAHVHDLARGRRRLALLG